MEAQQITLALTDTNGGYKASPERVRLSSLVDFTADVASLLKGDTKEVDVQALDVAVRDGRIKRGQTLMLEGVGGGFTWGSVLLRY